MTCSFEGAWLSLIMMVPLSGVSCTGGDYFRLPVTTAIPLSGVGCGPDDAWLPLIMAETPSGMVCRAEGAC
jgi:hypothetical protein